MAAVTVFVDKAVRGDFPPICVQTGDRAEEYATISRPVGGMGAGAWVLVLLGPLGWLALLLLASLGTGRETLTVRLPYSAQAIDRYDSLRRLRLIGWGIFLAGILALFLLQLSGPLWPIVGVGFLLVGFAQFRLAWGEVEIDLDASRRWVTIYRAHPAFVAAVELSTSEAETLD